MFARVLKKRALAAPLYVLMISVVVLAFFSSLVQRTEAAFLCSDGRTAPQFLGEERICPDGGESIFVENDFGVCPPGSFLQSSFGLDDPVCMQTNSSGLINQFTSVEPVKKAETLGFTSPEFWSTGYFLIYITSGIVGYAGTLLNASITHFVLNMGTYLGAKEGVGAGLNTAWKVIRDIVNLTFVFGLIYLAFMTIAQADTHKLKHGVTTSSRAPFW
jgi:hypothetical protein